MKKSIKREGKADLEIELVRPHLKYGTDIFREVLQSLHVSPFSFNFYFFAKQYFIYCAERSLSINEVDINHKKSKDKKNDNFFSFI